MSGALEQDDVTHSEGFKSRMVQRMSGREGISATALSREVGIAQPTLSRWLREARRVAPMTNHKQTSKGRPNRKTAEQKLRIVLAAAGLDDEALGAFLRREGVHAAQLEEWRAAVTASAMAALSPKPKSGRGQDSPEAKRIRELERELRRKEKALAEVAALLALKKRAAEIWGDEDDDTPTRSAT
jgi:transposase